MSLLKALTFAFLLLCSATLVAQTPTLKSNAAPKADDSAVKAIREGSEKFAAQFNAGKVDDLTNLFLAEGEYIDEEGIFRDTVVTKQQFTYKFMGEEGAKVGASAISTQVDGEVLIKVRHRGTLIAEGVAVKPFEPALAFSILK